MRVLRTGVNLKLPVHLLPHLRLGKHTLNRFFNHPRGTGLAHFARLRLRQAARITRVAAIKLLFFLAARQADLLGVDHNHVVAGIDKRCVAGLMFAHQQVRGFAGHAPQHSFLGINQVPVALDPGG